MYSNTKDKGDLGELAVLCFLKEQGFSVSIPFGENAPYDFVAESPSGKLYRLQVRWSSWKNDVLRLRLRAISRNYARTLDLTRIDAFVLWDGDSAYIIPVDETKGCTSEIAFRRDWPKNGQRKNIRLARDFKKAVHLLP